MKKLLFIFATLILTYSCSENTPKPLGYNRIDKPDYRYETFETDNFIFLYPSIAKIEILKEEDKSKFWFNMHYPIYEATIFCSYMEITPKTLNGVLEDNYQLAFSHALQANGIEQAIYEHRNNKVSGIIYKIEGNVATPLQFYATDSVRNFFRGSLYFDNKVREDSVSPVINYINEDIEKLISSLMWKN
jgi:gliding motility-associated lipoprotein GldD